MVFPWATMTFSEVSDPDDPNDVTTFTVAEDSSGSQAKVQTFVDAYNTLVDTIDSLGPATAMTTQRPGFLRGTPG